MLLGPAMHWQNEYAATVHRVSMTNISIKLSVPYSLSFNI